MKKTHHKYHYGTGKRKTSIARVFLKPGSGVILINKRKPEEYFKRDTLIVVIKTPLNVTGTSGLVDLYITVTGGGLSGQADAVKLGIARALVDYYEENGELSPKSRKSVSDAISKIAEASESSDSTGSSDDGASSLTSQATETEPTKPNYRFLLRKAGCLTRDSRIVERKKFGLKKARKAEQYSKR